MRRLITGGVAVLLAALLVVMSGGVGVGAQAPGAPSVSSVMAGDGSLAVVWTAPGDTGGSPITAYDLRHIASSSSDKSDGKWTAVDGIWTSGVLQYTVSGLLGAVSYDVQVRAVNSDGDGAWSATAAGTPTVGAATITSAAVGDEALTVVWDAPAGVAAASITAYDLRYIVSSASDKSDGKWTGVDDVWTSVVGGTLVYVLTGLTNGTGYDMQVRAVTDTDGDWSSTRAATPADPGSTGTDDAAAALVSGVPLGGVIQSTSDVDYYKVSLAAASGLMVYTTGALDTSGALFDSSQNAITPVGDCDPADTKVEDKSDTTVEDDSDFIERGKNFFISTTQQAGAYYIKVTGSGTGSYTVHAEAIPDTTGTSDAQRVELDGSRRGVVHCLGDTDYFKLALPQATDVIVRSSGAAVRDSTVKISDSAQKKVAENSTGFLIPHERHFLVRETLPAGEYDIEVKARFNTRRSDSDQGPYALHVQSVVEPGSTSGTAVPLRIGGIAGGNISSAADVDYFRIDIGEPTNAVVRIVSRTVDVDGVLLASDSSPVAASVHDESCSSHRKVHCFTMRHTLNAGTYYLKAAAAAGTAGAYTVQALDAADIPGDSDYDAILQQCQYSGTAVKDPLYGCQWNLKNIGLYGGTAGEDINVEDVWAAGNLGEGVAVAVVDVDLDADHEDLRENVDESKSHDYHGAGLLKPPADHGTSVAGVIAARDNGRGVRGVAPRATVYGYNLIAGGFTTANLVDAMTRNMDSTAVSNNSWGSFPGRGWVTVSQLWEEAVEKGVTEGFGGKGVLYVRAVGNNHEYGVHANYDEYNSHYTAVAVCALDKEGKRARYSQTGPALWVCAHSDDETRLRSYDETRLPDSSAESNPQNIQVMSTDIYNEYTDYFGGTSAAAPTVSGVAALVRSAYPSLTWRDVKLILAGSARKNHSDHTGWKSGALEYGYTTARYEFNHEYGFGAVDAKAAVDLAVDWTPLPGFVSEQQTSADEDITIPDTATQTTVESTVTVGTLVEFTEFVELNVEIDAPRYSHLDIDLVSPSGGVSDIAYSKAYCMDKRLCRFNSTFRFGSARHLGEDPSGVWTLKITDDHKFKTVTEPSTLKSWNLKVYGHRSTPGAPVADSVTAVDEGKVTVFWAAPDNAGASAVTAYDVRYITSDASDKSDSSWTVIDNAGANGRIRGYTISGLTDGTGYDVQVRAVNAQGDGVWSGTVTGTPAAAVSAPPYFTEGAATVRSVPENTAAGVSVGAEVTAVDTDGDALVYILGGTDAAHFAISPSTGQLRTKGALDYESKPVYTVTVSVSDRKDADGGDDTAVDDTITVKIGVSDTEEAGAVTLSTGNPRVGTAVAAMLADPDGSVTGTSWSWERSTDETVWTAITGAESSSHTPTSTDAGSYLRASAVYTDARGSGKTASAATQSKVSSPSRSPSGPFVPPTTTSLPPAPPQPQPRHPFSDLQEAGVHETAVTALADEGVLTGTGCDRERLCPKAALQRWEAAVWLVRILDGEEPAKTASSRFTDVNGKKWWATHVERLAELKITLGCSLNPARFCPDEHVTRAQMASFLTRAFKLPNARQPAGFGDTDYSVHEAAIDALHAARVTKGCRVSPLLYCPRHHTTRAQMASFLHRAHQH